MNKLKMFLLSLIISVPASLSLINNLYFSMHDDQHIARLYLLDQGIKQGVLYPRWVDTLGFNFGYPLFNFYPPLIYYIGELFHLLGFNYILSIKLVFMTAFVLGALGMYLLARKFIGEKYALLATVLFTFFSYHAVLIYVRGALAEFMSYSILPFVFLTIVKLYEKSNIKNSLFFALSFALLILAHPLIAFPALIFIGFFALHFTLLKFGQKDWLAFVKYFILGSIFSLCLSAFFWLPSMIEKRFTVVNDIFLASASTHFYKIHYVCPQQFYYSPWGYGGSIAGCFDGLSFQLGKIHIGLLLISILLSFVYLLKKKKIDEVLKTFYFLILMLLFSLLMTTDYSSFIWDNIKYLWYLQFPWRFLTFTGIFISLAGSYCLYFLNETVTRLKKFSVPIVVLLSILTIGLYIKYFRPQTLFSTTDAKRTSFEEIAWRISYTSHEFAPKGIKIKQTELGTRVIDIKKNEIEKEHYKILQGNATVELLKNQFVDKEFSISAQKNTEFRLNTFNFPGWTAYVDGARIQIDDNNKFKLITVNITPGYHKLIFKFENTPLRRIGDIVSLISAVVLFAGLVVGKNYRKIEFE